MTAAGVAFVIAAACLSALATHLARRAAERRSGARPVAVASTDDLRRAELARDEARRARDEELRYAERGDQAWARVREVLRAHRPGAEVARAALAELHREELAFRESIIEDLVHAIHRGPDVAWQAAEDAVALRLSRVSTPPGMDYAHREPLEDERLLS